jgi:hypothetical protein
MSQKEKSSISKEKSDKVKYLEKILDSLNKEEKDPNKNINILLKFHRQ